MTKPLKTIASEMYGDLRKGIPQSRVLLPKGLAITLTCTEGHYTLTCGRKNQLPSALELQIIANAFDLLQPTWLQLDIESWQCYRYTWHWVPVATLFNGYQ